MIYRGYHIVLQSGCYTVYAKEDPDHGYTGRQGTFNNRPAAEKWVRELNRAHRDRAGS